MKCLFILDSIPFPPRQGVELPNYQLLKNFSKFHNVDLAVIPKNKNGINDFWSRLPHLPKSVKKRFLIKPKFDNFVIKFLLDFLLYKPTFSHTKFDNLDVENLALKNHYDLIWCSPFGLISFIHFLKKKKIEISKFIAVGHNDAMVGLYFDGFKQLLRGRIGFDIIRFFNLLRLPWIYYYERKYLKKVNFIHVQTEKERKKLQFILGKNSSKIFCAQNGKIDMLPPRVKKKNLKKKILFMTTLQGLRGKEAEWFLLKVWPKIIKKKPNTLLLVVGSQPNNLSKKKYFKLKGIKFLGFANNLSNIYNSVDIALVPTLHSTGWINRLSDAIVCGLPIITTPEALSTIQGALPFKNGLTCNNINEFISNTLHLLDNSEMRSSMAKNNIDLAKSFNSWNQTCDKIRIEIEKTILK